MTVCLPCFGLIILFDLAGINEYVLAETVGAENCLGVAILIAAACFKPGAVERYDTRDSPFHFGEQVGPPSERANVLVELFGVPQSDPHP